MPLVAGRFPLVPKREYDEFAMAVFERERRLFRGHKLTCPGFLCSNARRALTNSKVDREIAAHVLQAYAAKRKESN